MSARGVLRSFAESREADHIVIDGGVSYGDARMVVAEIERLERDLAAARAEIDGPRNRCPQCDHLRLELGEARAEAEALRHDMERQADTLAELATENEALRKALAMMYDKWVDGDDCYEEPDTFSAFLGKAFQLSITEEDHVISLLGKDCPTRAIDAAIAKEQKP